MANEFEIFRSQYSAEQIENEITNGIPRIDEETRHWLVWDLVAQEWYDTEIFAEGNGAVIEGVMYASSRVGNVPPETGWTTTIPIVSSGEYLWQRIPYQDGGYTYITARQGVDGGGGGGGNVISVNGKDGVVILTAADIDYITNVTLKAKIEDLEEAISQAGKVETVNNKGVTPGTKNIFLTASDVDAIPANQKGVANGVAVLDANGKIPLSQLPVYDGSIE